jgi:hypothetical protein
LRRCLRRGLVHNDPVRKRIIGTLFVTCLQTAALPLSAQVQSSPAGAPYPPPPPPVPADPEMQEAWLRASKCYAQGWDETGPLRAQALAVTSRLDAPVGSEQWSAARAVVLRYLEKREQILQCIEQLSGFTPSQPKEFSDWTILKQRASSMRQGYMSQSKYDYVIMLRLLGVRVSEEKFSRLPY